MIAEGANTESNERCARMLLATGINPMAGQVNPLMAAIREKNYRVMRVLYEFGVVPESDGEVGKSLSPIQFALQYNDPKLLEEVLQWQNVPVEFSEVDQKGRNIFHMIGSNQDIPSFDALMNKVVSRN